MKPTTGDHNVAEVVQIVVALCSAVIGEAVEVLYACVSTKQNQNKPKQTIARPIEVFHI